jgi:membrane-bound lytic murein transglycosylase A
MIRSVFIFASLLLLGACTGGNSETAPLVLKESSYNDLPGWTDDRQADALAAFAKSCPRIMARDPAAPFGPDPLMGTYGQWQKPCAALDGTTDARAFFESWFDPWQAEVSSWRRDGLFTGYYEAELKGSRTQHGPYQHPLRLRPPDLVMVDLGEFRPELKGQRIAGRVNKGQLKPFEDRQAITAGKLPGDESLKFVWVDSPVDAFFLQVQGSGRITLDDGTVLRVGYDAQNGWPYTAIGRELLQRGELDKSHVSMQAIRAWLAAHPDRADEIMNANKSYVFFRVLDGEGPLGGEGVALTPERSLAVDRARIAYGIPAWIATEPPTESQPPLRRLMVAQDTGGAIRGPVRGDVFWGYGPQAADIAGKMKARGEMWLLLPKQTQ